MGKLRIAAVELERYDLPLVKPLFISSRQGAILTVTTECGYVGQGEIAPLPGFSLETLDEAIEDLEALHLEGEELSKSIDCCCPSTQFGVEMAFHQIIASSKGIPLHTHLSGTQLSEIPINGLLSADDPDLLKKAEAEFPCFKVKVGRQSLGQDIAAIKQLDAQLQGRKELRLDANRAWTGEEALHFVTECRECQIAYLEEPTKTLEELLILSQQSPIPLALDETIQEDPAIDLVQFSNLAAIILKPMLVGGVDQPLQLARQAHALGIKSVISSSFESRVGLIGLVEMAAAMPDPTVAVGLDTHTWFGPNTLPVHQGILKLKSPLDLFFSPNRKNLPALISPESTLSYGELYELVLEREKTFRLAGISTGDRVAWVGKSTEESLVNFLALMRMGAVACPLSERLSEDAQGKLVARLGCHYWETKSLDSSSGKLTAATILMTSGSSAEPKAVVHHLSHHLFSAKAVAQCLQLCKGDRWLLSLSLHHTAGIGIVFRCLTAGAAIVISPEKNLATVIKQQKITHLSLVATQLQRLLQEKSSNDSLKAILVGGGPIPPDLLRQAMEIGLPVHQSYGMTEMASTITCTSGQSFDDLLTAGQELPGREIMIGENSEILVRGDSLCAGYLNRDEVTPVTDTQGWLHTKDRGTFDSEGRLHVQGRLDRMFISGGENIQPEEIENYLLELPGIDDARVTPIKDETFGQRPVAYLRTNEELPAVASLRKALSSSLPHYKIPVAVYLLQ